MAVIKYKDANGNWQTVVGVVIQNEVVQTTGNSETAVMSQKAVTDELDGKLSLSGGTMSNPISFSNDHKNSINFNSGEYIDGYGNIVIPNKDRSYNVSSGTIANNILTVTSSDSSTLLGWAQVYIHSAKHRGLEIYGPSGEDYSLISFRSDAESVYFGLCKSKNGFLFSADVSTVSGCNMYAQSFVSTSDIRKKDIIEDINLNINDIANAPIFKFTWLDPSINQNVNVGTSAQYWKTILPEIVTEDNDDEKTLSMQYGVAALASSVSLAKKVVEQEETIKAQEARIKALEDAIAEIQNKLK